MVKANLSFIVDNRVGNTLLVKNSQNTSVVS